MAHSVFWPKKIFFYPIGNTSAVCLTGELPPEQPADILLLGCGDVRNVLYTVYADLGARKWSCIAYDDISLSFQNRDLSISHVAILNQLYQVHIFFWLNSPIESSPLVSPEYLTLYARYRFSIGTKQ